MTPLTICTFKWKPKNRYRSTFGPDAVRVLRNMVGRHYQKPHRFVCITDDATGLDGIETIPLWKDHADVPSPYGLHQPSCYRRLKLFSVEAEAMVGPRFLVLDLDTVITGDVSPIFDRPEPFVAWGETDKRSYYNGSMILMTAGARRQVWERFDPKRSPMEAKQAGKFGSDQGWLSHCLGKGEAMWGTEDGVYSYRVHIQSKGDRLPDNARLVHFHGGVDPWMPCAQRISWIHEHYR